MERERGDTKENGLRAAEEEWTARAGGACPPPGAAGGGARRRRRRPFPQLPAPPRYPFLRMNTRMNRRSAWKDCSDTPL